MIEPKRGVVSDQDTDGSEPSLAGLFGCGFVIICLMGLASWLVVDSIRRDEANQIRVHQDHQRMVQMFHDLQEQKRLFQEQKKAQKAPKSIKKVPQK